MQERGRTLFYINKVESILTLTIHMQELMHTIFCFKKRNHMDIQEQAFLELFLLCMIFF